MRVEFDLQKSEKIVFLIPMPIIGWDKGEFSFGIAFTIYYVELTLKFNINNKNKKR